MQLSSNTPHSEAVDGKASDGSVIRVLIADDHPVVCLGSSASSTVKTT